MQMPEVDQLRCFVAAAEALNFRKAASVVHLTPAALGKQVKHLEDRVGQALFVRSTRKVTLTREGETLLSKAHLALDALTACTQFDLENPRLTGTLTLGSRHELAMSWLVPTVRQLERSHPNLAINFYVGSGADLIWRVQSGEIDCAVTSTRVQSTALDFEQLHDEEYRLVASPKLLRQCSMSHFVDARKHVLLDASRDLPLLRYWKDSAPATAKLEFKKTLTLGTIDIMRNYALAGLGVGVLPLYFVRLDLAKGRLCEVFPSIKPQRDAFRLVFRRMDHKRGLYAELARTLRSSPLR